MGIPAVSLPLPHSTGPSATCPWRSGPAPKRARSPAGRPLPARLHRPPRQDPARHRSLRHHGLYPARRVGGQPDVRHSAPSWSRAPALAATRSWWSTSHARPSLPAPTSPTPSPTAPRRRAGPARRRETADQPAGPGRGGAGGAGADQPTPVARRCTARPRPNPVGGGQVARSLRQRPGQLGLRQPPGAADGDGGDSRRLCGGAAPWRAGRADRPAATAPRPGAGAGNSSSATAATPTPHRLWR
jgi:hypothetical protein